MEENETHPLFETDSRRIGDWQNWKHQWSRNPHLEVRVGMLHAAFDMQAYGPDYQDRLLFMIRAADGHDAPDFQWEAELLKAHPDVGSKFGHNHLRECAEVMKVLAGKAYKTLCDRYFKQRCGGHERGDTDALSGMSTELFGALMWFFHDRERRRYGRNLPRDERGHHDGIARKYLLELIGEAWAYDYKPWSEGTKVDEDVEAAFKTARPTCVSLLHDLGHLHILYDGDRKREVDEASMEAFRRLALFDADGKQVHRTTEEAVGTYAGRSLLILETKLRNDERLCRIAEAERKKREAEEELKRAQR